MAGFATTQAYIDAMRTQSRYRAAIKTVGTQVSNSLYTYWRIAGMPQDGTVPTVGLGGAVATDKDTPGAIEVVDAPAGQRNFLARLRVDRASSLTTVPGSYILCDRLAHANILNAQGSGSFSPVIDGTARLDAGEGAQIITEVTTAFSAANNTRNFTYTNQAGVTGRVTPDIVTNVSVIVDRTIASNTGDGGLWMPLQAGDTGVRSIQSTTLVSGTATGAFTIALVRPLAWIPQSMFLFPVEREYGFMKQFMEEIRPGACLFWLQIPTTISTTVFMGGITVVSG